MKSGVYLIKIIKRPIYYLREDLTQFATYNPNNKRFYVNKGASGHALLGLKSVEILAYPYKYYIINSVEGKHREDLIKHIKL